MEKGYILNEAVRMGVQTRVGGKKREVNEVFIVKKGVTGEGSGLQENIKGWRGGLC